MRVYPNSDEPKLTGKFFKLTQDREDSLQERPRP